MCSHDEALAAAASKGDLLAPSLITEFPHLLPQTSSVLIAQFHSPIIKFVTPAHPSGNHPLTADEIETQMHKTWGQVKSYDSDGTYRSALPLTFLVILGEHNVDHCICYGSTW